jgi:hypothetical protein
MFDIQYSLRTVKSIPNDAIVIKFDVKFNDDISDVNWQIFNVCDTMIVDRFNADVSGMLFPPKLRNLTFGYYFNQNITDAKWPILLHKIIFGYKFNADISFSNWPQSLRIMQLDHLFKRNVTKWPQFLATLIFINNKFLSRISIMSLPMSLTTLHIDNVRDIHNIINYMPAHVTTLKFNPYLSKIPNMLYRIWNPYLSKIPNTVQHLIFTDSFAKDIYKLPLELKSLTFGYEFNCDISNVNWSSYILLTSITFGYSYNQCLSNVKWPLNVTHLSFGCNFNQELCLPELLEVLLLNSPYEWNDTDEIPIIAFHFNKFNQILTHVKWPTMLDTIIFGRKFNQSMNDIILPNLCTLTFGYQFDQPIDNMKCPRLQNLTFGYCYNIILNVKTLNSLHTLILGNKFNTFISELPESLLVLTFGYNFNHPIDHIKWPTYLHTITFNTLYAHSISNVVFHNIGIVHDHSCKIIIDSCKFPKSLHKIIHYVYTKNEIKPVIIYEKYIGLYTKSAYTFI